MKQLVSYSFEAPIGDPPSCATPADVHGRIDSWLRSKGEPTDDGGSVAFRDGRLAQLERMVVISSQGRVTEVVLTEPTPGGWFRTSVGVAEATGLLAVAVHLSAGSSTLAPVHLDVRCPRLVRDLLAAPSPWKYRGTLLTSSPLDFCGEAGGDDFIALAWDSSRSVPLVAVSDEYGSVLHPGIVEALATDLAGLALVARLDPLASWRITRRQQKDWSCYGGALRLYWPALDSGSLPNKHPLWTPRRLLGGVADTETAAARIRSQLRRRILGQSAFAVSEPTAFAEIRRAARQEELSALRAKATPDVDYKSLAEEYFDRAANAHAELEKRDEEIEALKAKVRSLQYALQWRDEVQDEVAPDTDTPPSTVEEAVLVAMDRFDGVLVFGRSVDEGIQTLAQDAGPPDKILSY